MAIVSTWKVGVAVTVSSERHAALHHLRKYQPLRDDSRTVSLETQVELAFQARAATRWAADDVPWTVFCDAVLPYCCLDEPRHSVDALRRSLLKQCGPLVSGANDAGEAACMLNERVWDLLGVRFEPNLSPTYLAPASVINHGSASCTGLSLLLVACCRAVGVPARCAGVADWGDQSGNHVWVEVYSRGAWHALGACEPTALNDTWFAERLRTADGPRILASTYMQAGSQNSLQDSALCFPLPWQDNEPDPLCVPAVDVTSRYRSQRLPSDL